MDNKREPHPVSPELYEALQRLGEDRFPMEQVYRFDKQCRDARSAQGGQVSDDREEWEVVAGHAKLKKAYAQLEDEHARVCLELLTLHGEHESLRKETIALAASHKRICDAVKALRAERT